jgi:hypothetical protein
MFSGFYSNIRAFFLGFAVLFKRHASDKLGRHKARMLSVALLAVYYFVQYVQFAYHGKVVPKERLPDTMNLFFQLWMVPVLYLGFYQVVLFMSRDDVQLALSNAVAAVLRFAIATWQAASRIVRAGAARCAVFGRYVGRVLYALGQRLLRISHFVGGKLGKSASSAAQAAFAVSIVSVAVLGNGFGHLKQFASNCIEAGQNIQS